MPEAQRLKFYSTLIPAVAGLLTSVWTQYTSVAERQVKAGYDTLVESSKAQSERIRNLELLLSSLLVDAGRKSEDVAAVLGKPDPVIKLLAPSPHLLAPAIEWADAGVSQEGPAMLDSGVSVRTTDLRKLAQDVELQARAPAANIPAFDSL